MVTKNKGEMHARRSRKGASAIAGAGSNREYQRAAGVKCYRAACEKKEKDEEEEKG
jgi:hypothetical protein